MIVVLSKRSKKPSVLLLLFRNIAEFISTLCVEPLMMVVGCSFDSQLNPCHGIPPLPDLDHKISLPWPSERPLTSLLFDVLLTLIPHPLLRFTLIGDLLLLLYDLLGKSLPCSINTTVSSSLGCHGLRAGRSSRQVDSRNHFTVH